MNRELDKWIAENITNVDKVRNPEEWDNEFPRYGHEEFIYPRYTSDMNLAITLICLLPYSYLDYIGQLKKFHFTVESEGLDVSIFHESPAMVICLATYTTKTGKEWKEGKGN